ncbi:unnamed protein product, partial [Mesorhabditis spiculigera]
MDEKHKIVKREDLYKWANYIKGYRKRHFVLDTYGFLSYHKYNDDGVEPCPRGRINLRDANVYLDHGTSGFVVSAPSQSYHLKAGSSTARDEWMEALKLARHNAITAAQKEEDFDAEAAISDSSNGVKESKHPNYKSVHEELQNSCKLLEKQVNQLVPELSNNEVDLKKINNGVNWINLTTMMIMKGAKELNDSATDTVSRLEMQLKRERQRNGRLEEQILTLAHQQNTLENMVKRSSLVGDLDDFYDAEEEFTTSNVRRSSTASRLSDTTTDDSSKRSHNFDQNSPEPCSFNEPELGDSAAVIMPNGNDLEQTSLATIKSRRIKIPERPNYPLNLWSIMKNCIGRELSKIPMPVNFSEPLSMLQRVTEDLEYAYLLDKAVGLDPAEQMCYVAAFAVSSYATTGDRTTKPFNPVLGETFECDRRAEYGWRSITEQVSHHPPAAAHFVEGRGWKLHQEFTMTSRFRGRFLSVIPVGRTHIIFNDTNHHYSLTKVTTTVHNIIVGRLWIDNHGDMEIINHSNDHRCTVKFSPYSYFGKDAQRQVGGLVLDQNKVARFAIGGTWDSSLWKAKLSAGSTKPNPSDKETIWTAHKPIEGCEKMYSFTRFAIELNEPEPGVAPTDSRLRPDQRLMEEGNWDEANKRKIEIEEKQRARRRKQDQEAEKALKDGNVYKEHTPKWFVKVMDPDTNLMCHLSTGEYWECKKKQDWSACPELF